MKDEDALMSEVQARLGAKFAQLPPDQVSRAVAEARTRFAQSSVRDFIPLLVERRAGEDLLKQTQLVTVRARTPLLLGARGRVDIGGL